MKPLDGKAAVVAGATRGAGRGIACMLGEAGATVYCTGRSVRGQPATTGRPETIEETAEMVSDHGGVGIAVQVDHSVEDQVEALFARIRSDQGRLDVLVNDIWGGYFDRTIAGILERGPADADERLLLQLRYDQIDFDPAKAEEAERIGVLLGAGFRRANAGGR